MKTTARILPGLEEARDGKHADFLLKLGTKFQGWVTANYLAGSLGSDNNQMQPKGALDWGGASAQVC